MLGSDSATTSVQAKFCVWEDLFKSAACGVSCRTNTCSAPVLCCSSFPCKKQTQGSTYHWQGQIKLHFLFIGAHCVLIRGSIESRQYAFYSLSVVAFLKQFLQSQQLTLLGSQNRMYLIIDGYFHCRLQEQLKVPSSHAREGLKL